MGRKPTGNPVGRPKKIDKANAVICIRITKLELLRIDQLRGDANRASWVRAIVLDRIAVTKVEGE